MTTIDLFQVDAFTTEAFAGNPAAVCLLDQEPPSPWMQSMAQEMNLSETGFVWRHGEDWRLRWFTPASEVRLCGHATLAAGHALWESGRIDASCRKIRFHTQAGVLEVARESSAPTYRLALPRIDLEPLDDQKLSDHTGANSLHRTVGPGDPDVLAELPLGAVRRFEPDLELLRERQVGLIVTALPEKGDDADFVSRYFAPYWGIPEDPVTGSAHAALFPFWVPRLSRQPLRARQLSARGGFLLGETEGEKVLLRGDAITVFRGRTSPMSAPPGQGASR